MITASAPGKLMLFGEYAVLANGLSIVTATTRRVHAALADEPSGYTTRGPDLSADTTLPACAIEATGSPAEWLHRLSCDVSELFEGDKKLGLGSSAASTVAIVRALRAAQALPDDPRAIFDAAATAHRKLQRGRGSNADVAASAFGGLITYRLDAPQAPFPALHPDLPTPQIEPLPPLPASLAMRAVWLGEPASSTQLIGAIEQALSTSTRDLILQALRDLDASARSAAAAILAGDAAAIMAEVTRSDDALDRLGAAANAPIITPQHRALRAWAAAHGATTKPSGAGGGDFSVVIGPAPLAPLTSFAALTEL